MERAEALQARKDFDRVARSILKIMDNATYNTNTKVGDALLEALGKVDVAKAHLMTPATT
jgi:hypothetical protein